MFRIFFLGILLLCLSVTSGKAQPPLLVGYFDFPPFYSRNLEGQPEGILIDIAREQFAQIGRDVQFVYGSASELVEGVGSGKIDVGFLIPYPPLEGRVLYTHKPVSAMELMAFRGVQTSSLSGLSDLAGQDVLSLRGYAYGGLLTDIRLLQPTVNLIEASDIHSGLDLLLAGRGDYFLSYLKPSQQIAERKGFLLEDHWLLADKLAQFDIYIVLSMQTPGAQDIVDALNAKNR